MIYIICVIGITTLSILYFSKSKIQVIQYDIAGYYAYLPSIFIYGNLKKVDWRSEVKKNYSIQGINEVAWEYKPGMKVIKYSSGMAISYLPGFALAHIYALNSDYPSDGFSLPYQLGLIIIGWIYMLIALWYLRKILKLYFEDWIVAITLAIIALGTNYYIYAGSQSMMSHSFLFMLYTLVIYHTCHWYLQVSYWRIAIIGALLGLIAITRPTEVLLTMLVLFWGVHSLKGIKSRLLYLWKQKSYVIVAIITATSVISLQLLYWHHVTGDWIVYSYKDESFSWDGRYLINCLIGFRKGWLIYTPVMLLGIIGSYFLYKNKNTSTIAMPIILYLLINSSIIFSWDNYWYGGGFGQRAMISSYVLFAFPISALIQSVSRKSIGVKAITTVYILFCIWLNMFQTFQAQLWGGFETRKMTKKYYFKIFGHKNINPEWKVLLNNTDAYMGKITESHLLFEEDFEDYLGTMERPYKGTKTAKISEKGLYELLKKPINGLSKGQILRAETMVSGTNQVWDRFMMSNLHIQLLSKGKVLSDQAVKLHDIAVDSTWKSIHVDIVVPDENIDKIKVLAWSNLPDKFVFVDELKVEIIE